MCYAVPRTTVVLHVVRGFTFHFFTIFAKGKAMAHMHFIFSGKPSAALGFLNKNLEIRKNRVNTHTHTHTGLARQYTANHLIHKGLAAVFLQLSALLFRENHIMHTVSPPCGNALAETFIYPRNRVTHVNAVPAGFRGFLYLIKNK